MKCHKLRDIFYHTFCSTDFGDIFMHRHSMYSKTIFVEIETYHDEKRNLSCFKYTACVNWSHLPNKLAFENKDIIQQWHTSFLW